MRRQRRRFGIANVRPKYEYQGKLSFGKHRLVDPGIRFESRPSTHCTWPCLNKSLATHASHPPLSPSQIDLLPHHIFQPGHRSIRLNTKPMQDSFRSHFDMTPNPQELHSICSMRSSGSHGPKITMGCFILVL